MVDRRKPKPREEYSANSPTNVVILDTRRAKPQLKKPKPQPTDLSFVRRIGRGHMGSGLCFWVVETTISYTNDCITGRRLALEYLTYLAAGGFLPLQWIVLDMPRRQRGMGIEVGFLGTVGGAAGIGAYIAGDRIGEINAP